MQNELDIPDPCPGAVYVLQSSCLLFSPLCFCHILSLHLVYALRVEVAFKISHITQNLVELCLELKFVERVWILQFPAAF